MPKSEIRKINAIIKEMLGKPMTKEQLKFQDELRDKVRKKEITMTEAHIIWSKKYKLSDLNFWQSLKERGG